MTRSSLCLLASVSLAVTPTAALARSGNFGLKATIPVHCIVEHQPSRYGVAIGEGIALGELNEFCNAPGGYELVVSYTPGSLKGAMLAAGEDQVVLNGSGFAVLSRATGPRMRARTLAATPGAAGFDADRLEFEVRPQIS